MSEHNNNSVKSEHSFIAACEKAGIPPTSAQASKWRRGYGLAYTTHHGLSLGSKINQHSGISFSDQRAKGATKTQDYGPYSSTPNEWPKVRK